MPFDDRHSSVPIPKWHVVMIGNGIPHHSHELLSFRGITYCNLCGGFGVKRSRLLNRPCDRVCTVASDRARTRLKQEFLPVVGMSWPPPTTNHIQPPVSATYEDPPVSHQGPHPFDDGDAPIWEDEW